MRKDEAMGYVERRDGAVIPVVEGILLAGGVGGQHAENVGDVVDGFRPGVGGGEAEARTEGAGEVSLEGVEVGVGRGLVESDGGEARVNAVGLRIS